MQKQYFYGRQYLDDEDRDKALQVLKSDFLSQGPVLEKFEQSVSQYFGSKYCIAVSNATAALHLACRSLGVEDGDIVWTTSLSFVATANAVRYCGAKVEFIDINSDTFNLSISQLQIRLDKAKSIGKLPKVLIPVHFAGEPCEMIQIHKLSKIYGFKILEDAAQAMGATYFDSIIGDCRYSDVTVFSLHPVKSITSGEGGLILTNSKSIYKQALIERTHGINRKNVTKNTPPWVAEMESEGFNYKLTEFQCSLGVSQLKKLDAFMLKRRQLADIYKQLMKNTSATFQSNSNKSSSAWHLMIIKFDFNSLGINKKSFYNHMKDKGINLALHYYPIHLHSFYQGLGFKKGSLPNTEEYYEQAFTFPLHYSIERDDVEYICKQIQTFTRER